MLFGAGARAQQPSVQIVFDGGRVTLAAGEAPLGDVLAEWGRVGGTRITGIERLAPVRLTKVVVAADERTVLEELIGSTSGLITKDRAEPRTNASRFESVAIVASPRAPTNSAVRRPAIDPMLPEARFDYAAPPLGSADDPNSPAARLLAIGAEAAPPVVAPGAPPPPIPELLYQYAEPPRPSPADERADHTPPQKPEETFKPKKEPPAR
jgi:hypothetical protein